MAGAEGIVGSESRASRPHSARTSQRNRWGGGALASSAHAHFAVAQSRGPPTRWKRPILLSAICFRLPVVATSRFFSILLVVSDGRVEADIPCGTRQASGEAETPGTKSAQAVQLPAKDPVDEAQTQARPPKKGVRAQSWPLALPPASGDRLDRRVHEGGP